MSKKYLSILLLIVVFAVSTQVFAQSTTDLIILLDSSQSMIPYYNDVTEFICKSVLPSYLRYGDRFHVLTFSDSVQNPISQEVLTTTDINSIVAGILLLYPLGTSTDLITALESTWKWTLDLPSNSNKVIVMITDGMHAPLTSSPYYSLSTEAVKTEISRITEQIKSQHWTFKLITVPFSADTVSGAENSKAPGSGIYTDTIASSAGTSAVEFQKGNETAVIGQAFSLINISCPNDLGKHNYTFKIPVTLSNPGDYEITAELIKIIINGKTNVLSGKASGVIPAKSSRTIMIPLAFPRDWPSGQQSITIEPVFADNLRVTPPVLQTNVVLKYSFFTTILSNVTQLILSLLILAAIIALIIVVLLYIRSIHRQASQPVVDAVFDSMQAQKLSEQTAPKDLQRRVELLAEKSVAPSKAAVTEQKQTKPIITSDSKLARGRVLPAWAVSSQPSHQTIPEQLVTATHKAIDIAPNKDSDHIQERLALLSQDTTKQKEAERLLAVLKKQESQISLPTHRKPIAYNPSITKPGSVKVEFIVENQNRCIGKRNIKVLHAGGRKTIGGKLSDFFIFLYPFPNHIADVYYDGESIIVVPRKCEYFPDYNSAITLKFDEQVRIVTKKGKEVFFTFSLYVPPYEKINRILKCVEIPIKEQE